MVNSITQLITFFGLLNTVMAECPQGWKEFARPNNKYNNPDLKVCMKYYRWNPKDLSQDPVARCFDQNAYLSSFGTQEDFDWQVRTHKNADSVASFLTGGYKRKRCPGGITDYKPEEPCNKRDYMLMWSDPFTHNDFFTKAKWISPTEPNGVMAKATPEDCLQYSIGGFNDNTCPVYLPRDSESGNMVNTGFFCMKLEDEEMEL